MPTIVAYHQIKDAKHWLSSSKREELFGPLASPTSVHSSTRRTRRERQ